MTAPRVHNRAHYVAGCRHPDCLAANAAYMARWRERRRPQAVAKDKTPLEQALEAIATTAVEGECIPWQGYLNRDGYGTAGSAVDGNRLAHRIVYARSYGPIPGDLTVDHMCFNRACVNPAHLRLLTRAENTRNRRPLPPGARPTRCVNGHDFTPDNTYVRADDGTRNCRACNRAAARRYARRKASA